MTSQKSIFGTTYIQEAFSAPSFSGGVNVLDGDLVLEEGALVDGVEVSDLKESFDSHVVAANPHGTTTTNVVEGTNLYYTEARVDANIGTKTTDDIAEGTNLYYTEARVDANIGTKTTDDVAEGTNLYYTEDRVDANIGTKTTSDLAEGTNFYYTDARVDANIGTKTTDDVAEGTNLYYTEDRVNANIGTKTTDDLAEGANLYFTEARVNANIGAKTTDDLAEGANLYYTEARVDANIGTKTTDDIAEGTNLYYTEARVDANIGTKTTDDIAEGTNLYYTEARVDANIGAKTTDDLVEGANLYYTEARVDANIGTKTTDDIAEGTNLYYTEDRVDANIGTKTTDDIAEGTNLYYTETRVDANIGAKTTDDLVEGANLYYTEARVDANIGTKTTDDIAEGTNLYYTEDRVDANIGAKTTDDIAEGTNLYYTEARVDANIGTKTTDDIAEGTNLYYTEDRVDANIGTKTTDDIAEGTNLYYTEARVDANIGAKTTSDIAEGTNLYYTEARVSGKLDADGSNEYLGQNLVIAGDTTQKRLSFKSSASADQVDILVNPTQAFIYTYNDRGIKLYVSGTTVRQFYVNPNGNAELFNLNLDLGSGELKNGTVDDATMTHPDLAINSIVKTGPNRQLVSETPASAFNKPFGVLTSGTVLEGDRLNDLTSDTVHMWSGNKISSELTNVSDNADGRVSKGGDVMVGNLTMSANQINDVSQVDSSGAMLVKSTDDLRVETDAVSNIYLQADSGGGANTLTINPVNDAVELTNCDLDCGNGNVSNVNNLTMKDALTIGGNPIYTEQPPILLPALPYSVTESAYTGNLAPNGNNFSFNTPVINAFNDGNGHQQNGTYDMTNNGLYSAAGSASTTIDGVTYAGVWHQLDMGGAKDIGGYYWNTIGANTSPVEVRVAGSNDGATWTGVSHENDIVAASPGSPNTFYFPTVSYRYWRFVVIRTPVAGVGGSLYYGQFRYLEDTLTCSSGSIEVCGPSSNLTVNHVVQDTSRSCFAMHHWEGTPFTISFPVSNTYYTMANGTMLMMPFYKNVTGDSNTSFIIEDAGYYQVNSSVVYDANANGDMAFQSTLAVNQSSFKCSQSHFSNKSGETYSVSCSDLMYLNTGDDVRIMVRNTSTISVNIYRWCHSLTKISNNV